MEVKTFGDTTVITLIQGVVDDRTVPDIQKKVCALIDSGRLRLVVDLRNVTFLTSTAISMFDTFRKKLQAAKGQLVICNMLPQIREVFDVLKLRKFYDIRDNYDPETEAK